MSTVWIAGSSSYETTGVIHLLKSHDIVVRPFRAGDHFGAGDALILCFSSAPLLGWSRYLKITQWVAHRYDIRLIVLCPDEVYQTGILSGRKRVAVNGRHDCFHLSHVLQQAVMCRQGEETEHSQAREMLSFWPMASQALLARPASESERSAVRKEYNRRWLLVQHMGFSSLLKLKVFMAGLLR